ASQPAARRLQALHALVAARDNALREAVAALLADRANPADLRASVLGGLERLDDAWVAEVVLAGYANMEPEPKPKATPPLTGRAAWAHPLLDAIGRGHIAASAVNVNQVRKLLDSKDDRLAEKVHKLWGSVRAERDPQREEVIAQMRRLVRREQGDPHEGLKVF